MVYTDRNNDGRIDIDDDVLQETHYYPYGMPMKGYWLQEDLQRPMAYQFNGIERVDPAGFELGVNMAFYRTLDPALGQWWSVDPKAELYVGMSPYCAMGGSPFVYNDPDGDALPAIAVAAIAGGIIGGIGNTVYQATQGNINSVGDGLAAFGIGAVAGGVGAAAGSFAIMGSAAFTVGATATGVSIGGYTLGTTGFVSGALSGAVGGAVSSPLRQIGNQLAGWQDEFSYKEWGMEIAMGFGIGGLVGGITAAIKGQNFWWGNSVKITPESSVVAGLERVVDPKAVLKFAKNYDIYATQSKVYSGGVDKYYQQMLNNEFDPTLTKNMIGGYVKDGKYIIGEGHHRVAAAIKYGMEKGNYTILENILQNARWTHNPNYNINYNLFPKTWK